MGVEEGGAHIAVSEESEQAEAEGHSRRMSPSCDTGPPGLWIPLPQLGLPGDHFIPGCRRKAAFSYRETELCLTNLSWEMLLLYRSLRKRQTFYIQWLFPLQLL